MVEWLEWGPEAFARAARDGKPVLLSISAAWCRACHEMDATTYADPEVDAAIASRFVAVRVDTDRRPDINDRYNLGGWPTTAFLDADGAMLTGGTFVPVDRMRRVLSDVADAYAAVPASASIVDNRVGEAVHTAVPDDDALIARIFTTFDCECGGFGIEPKFPHTAPLHLALELHGEGADGEWRAMVERTLDAIADGGLRDTSDGGYFRYAVTRDWQVPHREKLLETNAALLRVFVDASVTLGRDVDVTRAASVASFLTGILRADGGGYGGSDADAVLYMDANARAASALIAAAAAFHDNALAAEALSSFERVTLACYRPGAGLAHVFDGAARVRGLLGDHTAAIEALLDAHELTGDEPYLMLAQELAQYLLGTLADEHGGFADRAASPDDIGLLRERRRPFRGNAEAAAALARLAGIAGVKNGAALIAAGAGALRAAAPSLEAQGPLAAHYVLARRRLRRVIDFRSVDA